jgi:hypothetical protein
MAVFGRLGMTPLMKLITKADKLQVDCSHVVEAADVELMQPTFLTFRVRDFAIDGRCLRAAISSVS